jgi:hypothetical protein
VGEQTERAKKALSEGRAFGLSRNLSALLREDLPAPEGIPFDWASRFQGRQICRKAFASDRLAESNQNYSAKVSWESPKFEERSPDLAPVPADHGPPVRGGPILRNGCYLRVERRNSVLNAPTGRCYGVTIDFDRKSCRREYFPGNSMPLCYGSRGINNNSGVDHEKLDSVWGIGFGRATGL